MLLIDEAVVDENNIAHCKYTIKEDEFFTRGHFPGHLTLYAGLDKVRFKNPVKSGDVCEITARLIEKRGSLYFCSAKLEVGGKLCCKGELTFALIPKEK